MKRCLLLAATIAVCSSVQAQNFLYDDNSPRSYWGVRVGWDLTMPTDWHVEDFSTSMFRNGSGVSAGVVYNMPVGKSFYFEPEVGIFYNTYRYRDLTISGETYNLFDPEVRKFGVRIPLTLGWRTELIPGALALGIFTGPQVNIGIDGRLGLDSNEATDLNLETNIYCENGQHRVSLDWAVGASVMFGSWQVDISGSFGISDMQKNTPSFRENRLNVSLGYNF